MGQLWERSRKCGRNAWLSTLWGGMSLAGSVLGTSASTPSFDSIFKGSKEGSHYSPEHVLHWRIHAYRFQNKSTERKKCIQTCSKESPWPRSRTFPSPPRALPGGPPLASSLTYWRLTACFGPRELAALHPVQPPFLCTDGQNEVQKDQYQFQRQAEHNAQPEASRLGFPYKSWHSMVWKLKYCTLVSISGRECELKSTFNQKASKVLPHILGIGEGMKIWNIWERERESE